MVQNAEAGLIKRTTGRYMTCMEALVSGDAGTGGSYIFGLPDFSWQPVFVMHWVSTLQLIP